MKTLQKNLIGFTLIELLVVIAIIGILATVVIGSVNSARYKAADISTIQSLSGLRAQIEMYNSSNATYGAIGTGTVAADGTTNGLSGACAAAEVQELLASAARQADNTLTCIIGQNGRSWLTYVELKTQTSPENFCVDSSGFVGRLTTAPLEESPFQEVKCQ